MTYKSVSIVITDDVSDTRALDAAIGLCDREKVHLDVVCIGVDPFRSEIAPVGAAPALVQTGTAEAQERAQALENWAGTKLASVAFSYGVRGLAVTTAGMDAAIAHAVRYCDLVVASQPYGEGATPFQVTVLEAALFGTGAPVLVIPRAGAETSKPLGRVMVAWNETDEALEAVRKALPVIAESDRTEIVMVAPPSHSPERSDPGGAISVMLARHGVKPEAVILSKTLPRVSDVLMRHATDTGADLIVMGAYGHSRFREALIGGATRDMLEQAKVPVLMAH